MYVYVLKIGMYLVSFRWNTRHCVRVVKETDSNRLWIRAYLFHFVGAGSNPAGVELFELFIVDSGGDHFFGLFDFDVAVAYLIFSR